MGFCYFCQKEGNELNKIISQLEMERDMLVGRALTLEDQNEELFQRCTALESDEPIIQNLNQSKAKMICIVKEALIARKMTSGEANNFISLLLK